MNLIKVISINFLSAVMIILIFEFIWGGWFFAENKKYCTYILCSFDVVFESPSTGKTKYSKDKFGLRGRKNINNDIDILIIGGSTADQKYVDDNATWDFFLERKFRESGKDIDIVNAAIDGQSSVGHIWNFQEWFVNIPNFSPRYILFYIGINDIAPRDIVRSFDGATETWKHVIKRNSVLYKIYFDFLSNQYQTAD